MSWITKLYETYENASEIIGIDNEGVLLLPIAHSTQNAQITVVISEKSEFLRAEKVEKEQSVTLIPVTEDSASRSSGIAPHPLCDKLIYAAGDYDRYVKGKKTFYGYFEKYMEQLQQWTMSEDTNGKVLAVFHYLEKETLIQDLCKAGVLVQDEDGLLDGKSKIAGVAQEDSFIRFRVERIGMTDGYEDVWKDPELYQSFINYYLHSFDTSDLCYACGKRMYCSDKHPGKVRNTADKSKLISANDTSGFLYRGRFDKKEEANSVGYEVSQKAHNALKWLIKKQGGHIGEMAFVAWGTRNPDIPDVLADTQSIWEEDWGDEEYEDGADTVCGEYEDGIPGPEDGREIDTEGQSEIEKEIVLQSDTRQKYAQRLKRAVFREEKEIEPEEDIVFLTVEAATTGRLSITYYKELLGSQFYDNLVSWHAGCSWRHYYKYIDKKMVPFTGAPALRDIVQAAYGAEQNSVLMVKDKVEKAAIQRLLPCIVENRTIPFDLVIKLLQNASSPMRYSGYNRGKIRTIACAVIRKYYNDKNDKIKGTGEWKMALQEERTDRDYLYGRLLAVAQVAERVALKGADRDTNAERYMSAFQKRPFMTWILIHDRLQPYLRALGKRGEYYKKQMRTIMEQFETDESGKNEFEDNKALSGTFLLGYSCQLNSMKKSEKTEEK